MFGINTVLVLLVNGKWIVFLVISISMNFKMSIIGYAVSLISLS